MASGIGIGGLALGLSQGLQSGISLGKAMLDKDKYDLERPELELKADMAKRKVAATKQATDSFANWQKENLYDGEGNLLPPEQRPSQTAVLTKMFEFKNLADIENNIVDPEEVTKRTKAGRYMMQENMMSAWEQYERSGGNPEAAFKAFNESGMKVPEGTTIRPFVDKDSGVRDIGVFAPDGTLITTRNTSLAMMSYENISKMNELNILEGGRNKRQDSQNATTMGAAGVQAGATIEAQKLRNIASAEDNAARIKAEQIRDERLREDSRLKAIREGQVTPKDEYAAFNNSFNTVYTGLTRDLAVPGDKMAMARVYAQGKARAADILSIARQTGKRVSMEEAIRIGLEEALKANQIGTNPNGKK